jgi:hypothetical protein
MVFEGEEKKKISVILSPRSIPEVVAEQTRNGTLFDVLQLAPQHLHLETLRGELVAVRRGPRGGPFLPLQRLVGPAKDSREKGTRSVETAVTL